MALTLPWTADFKIDLDNRSNLHPTGCEKQTGSGGRRSSLTRTSRRGLPAGGTHCGRLSSVTLVSPPGLPGPSGGERPQQLDLISAGASRASLRHNLISGNVLTEEEMCLCSQELMESATRNIQRWDILGRYIVLRIAI